MIFLVKREDIINESIDEDCKNPDLDRFVLDIQINSVTPFDRNFWVELFFDRIFSFRKNFRNYFFEHFLFGQKIPIRQ